MNRNPRWMNVSSWSCRNLAFSLCYLIFLSMAWKQIKIISDKVCRWCTQIGGVINNEKDEVTTRALDCVESWMLVGSTHLHVTKRVHLGTKNVGRAFRMGGPLEKIWGGVGLSTEHKLPVWCCGQRTIVILGCLNRIILSKCREMTSPLCLALVERLLAHGIQF